MREITPDEVLEMVREAVKEAGSQAAFARNLKINSQVVWMAMQGVNPCKEILDALNVERTVTKTVTYRRKTP